MILQLEKLKIKNNKKYKYKYKSPTQMYLTVQMDAKILQKAAKSSLSFLYHLDKQVDEQL